MIINHRTCVIIWLILIVLLFPVRSEAYIDPGTGGLLYQIGFALFSFLGVAIFVPVQFFKTTMTKVKAFFSKSQSS